MAQSISQEAIVNTGLPGATAASRYAGATASGAPTTGTFAVGDYVVDQTGAMYVCTVAGTPGTWQLSGVSVNENIAGKNFVINGGFDIWQRGTTFSTNGSQYTADRWYSSINNNTTSQQTSGVPVGTTANLRVAYTSTGGYGNQFSALESANAKMLVGKTVTVSAKFRCNASFAASGASIGFAVQKNSTADTMNGGTWTTISSSTVAGSSLPTGTTASDWYSLSFTTSIPNDGTAAGIRIQIAETITGISPSYWEVAAVQMEIAPQATPFSRAGGSIGGELALCMRYYERRTAAGANFGIGIPVSLRSSTSAYGAVTYGAPKRVNPTIDFSNIYVQFGNTTNCTPTGMAGVYGAGSAAGWPSAGFDITLSGSGVANAAGWLIDSGGGAGYIAFLAEL